MAFMSEPSSSEYYTQGDIACSENNGMTYKYMVNLAPIPSASISGNGIAQWEAVEKCASYDIQLYKTEDGGEPLGKVYHVSMRILRSMYLILKLTENIILTVKTVGDGYYIASEKQRKVMSLSTYRNRR